MDYDPETLRQWDREHVWHPFTQMQGFREETPLIISRGEGIYLFDHQGNRYLDGVSSLWANLHGHRRRELDQALVAQLSQVAHSTLLGIANPPAILLARRLAELAPAGLNKVFFSDNGSTAVEAALKMAFQCWRNRGQARKQRFLKLNGAYHGDTLGAVSVGGIPLFHEIYQPLLFDTLEAPAPYCYRCDHREDCREQCLVRLEELVAAHHQELAVRRPCAARRRRWGRRRRRAPGRRRGRCGPRSRWTARRRRRCGCRPCSRRGSCAPGVRTRASRSGSRCSVPCGGR